MKKSEKVLDWILDHRGLVTVAVVVLILIISAIIGLSSGGSGSKSSSSYKSYNSYNDYNGNGEYDLSDYMKDEAPDLYNDIKDRYESLQ